MCGKGLGERSEQFHECELPMDIVPSDLGETAIWSVSPKLVDDEIRSQTGPC